jgi:exodeoxyribonuclease V alpha subunit
MGQPASTSTATEVLGGLVERVTFHNEENGFCVLRVKARGQRDLITVLGHAAVISAGEFVTVPAAGHMVIVEKADSVVAALARLD